MDTGKNFLERRKHERLKLKKGVCAVLMPGNKRGQIKEIREGGLVFQCVDNKTPIRSPVKIDIFSSGYDFYLSNVPVRSTCYYKKDTTDPLSLMSIRRLNIKIGKMTITQIMLLDYFLEEYIFDENLGGKT